MNHHVDPIRGTLLNPQITPPQTALNLNPALHLTPLGRQNMMQGEICNEGLYAMNIN